MSLAFSRMRHDSVDPEVDFSDKIQQCLAALLRVRKRTLLSSFVAALRASPSYSGLIRADYTGRRVCNTRALHLHDGRGEYLTLNVDFDIDVSANYDSAFAIIL